MNNFNDFISKDIEAKKTLISTMPTRTKTNKNRLNDKIIEIEEKYIEYKDSVKNYLIAKSNSFVLTDTKPNVDKIKERIEELEHVRFLTNPYNTYFEKMGFDDLLYQINNYYLFNFNSLDNIINGFLDKFELAGIRLSSDDFDYTSYVHDYMKAFLEVRYAATKNYDKVNETFEEIYWYNPEIIDHIELNLRKLIRKNERRFEMYILKIQKEIEFKNQVKNYYDCLDQLQKAYTELESANEENVNDVIGLALNGEIDINHYLDDSKLRKSAYDSLIVDSVDREDPKAMKKVYVALEKLRHNIDEYYNYTEIIPLIDAFRTEYEKIVLENNKNKTNKNDKEKSPYKVLLSQINEKEADLDRINKKIFGRRIEIFKFNNDTDIRQQKIITLRKAKELDELYKKLDIEYFKEKVLAMLSDTFSVSDFLDLFYSFDYFKKLYVQKVYDITVYDDIIKYCKNFDLFAMDLTNIIVRGLSIFEEQDIPQIIINKYRLSNIKLTEDDLSPESLKSLTNRIMMILRIHQIDNSETTLEKIWFMVQVNKMLAKDNK